MVYYNRARACVCCSHWLIQPMFQFMMAPSGVLRTATVKDELFLFMRTLRDMNMSKLVFDDIELFISLLGDLFPGLTADKVWVRATTKALVSYVPRMSCASETAPCVAERALWTCPRTHVLADVGGPPAA